MPVKMTGVFQKRTSLKYALSNARGFVVTSYIVVRLPCELIGDSSPSSHIS